MGTKKGIKPRKWSKEEKLKLVQLHLEEKLSLRQIEKEFSVSSGLLSTWAKKYLEEGEESLESRRGNPYSALHASKSLSEIERLRLIVAKQEVEIARLKKGYWVEGVGANKEYVTGNGKSTKSSKNSKKTIL
jgi:transposase-like protein